MRYTITLPRNSYDRRGRAYEVCDFASLRKFFVEYKLALQIRERTYFHYSNLEDLLKNGDFMSSDMRPDSYIFCTCLYEDSEEQYGSWDEFIELDYYYSNTMERFVHPNTAVYINDLEEYVSESYADYHFYLHSNGDWYSEQEEFEEQEEYVNKYHSGYSGHFIPFPDSKYYGKYQVGIEFEKEDYDVKTSLYINDFEEECPYWRKEEDGSLDDESGFELISPIFTFDIDGIVNHIKENAILLNHVNAEISTSCGGHINLSEIGVESVDLFDRMKLYLPLLYAMYPARRGILYCQKKKILGNEDSFQSKYSAICIKSDRIEFRIFPGIKNINQLKFRLELVEMFINNPISDLSTLPEVILQNKSLFMKVYTEDRFRNLLSRVEMEIKEELECAS